jgi:hypothetical protein
LVRRSDSWSPPEEEEEEEEEEEDMTFSKTLVPSTFLAIASWLSTLSYDHILSISVFPPVYPHVTGW